MSINLVSLLRLTITVPTYHVKRRHGVSSQLPRV